MKKTVKRIICAFVMCTVLMMTFTGKEVQAAAKTPLCAKNQTVYYSVDVGLADVSQWIFIKNLASDAVISNIKSSNTSITGYSYKDYGLSAIAVQIVGYIKTGDKAKLSFDVKQNGKKYKLYCNITMKQMESPLKSLKIGNKKYTLPFRGFIEKYVNFPKSTFQLSCEANSGYKVEKISIQFKDGTIKDVKNGAKVNGKNIFSISIVYKQNKKPANYTFKAGTFHGGTDLTPLHSNLRIYDLL